MFQCDSRLPPSPTVPFACELRFFLFNLQSTGSDHVGNSRSGRGLQPLHFPSEHPIILTSYSLSRSTATLMDFPASVANKRLTARLNSLDATLHLQETRGEALFCAAKKSTHLFSSDSALSTAKHRDGGTHIPGAFVSPMAESANSKIPALPELAGYLCQRIRFQLSAVNLFGERKGRPAD